MLSRSNCPIRGRPIIETINHASSKEKYTVHLSSIDIVFMHNMLCSRPEVFSRIQDAIDAIMVDGKVDVFDLPHVIRLCAQLYDERKIAEAFQQVDVIALIRFTLDALLDANILSMDDDVTQETVKKITDASLVLLAMSVSRPQSQTSCVSKLLQCFCTFIRTPFCRPSECVEGSSNIVGATSSTPHIACGTCVSDLPFKQKPPSPPPVKQDLQMKV